MGIYLDSCKGEQGNSDFPVSRVYNPFGLTSELNSGSPAGDPNGITRYLAEYMKIKPCWIRRLKRPQVPCYDDPNRKQQPPTHSIQNSMNLKQTHKHN